MRNNKRIGKGLIQMSRTKCIRSWAALLMIFILTAIANFSPAQMRSLDPSTVTEIDGLIVRHEDGGAANFHALSEAQSVAGKTYADALPGQKMHLAVNYTPSTGVVIVGYTWQIDDTNFANYTFKDDDTGCTGHIDALTEVSNPHVHFYWANAKQHKARVKIALSNGNTVICGATFSIAEPTVLFKAVTGACGKGTINTFPGVGLLANNLQFPAPGVDPQFNGNGVGIVFTSSVQMPAGGWASGYSIVTQLVTTDEYHTIGEGNQLQKAASNGVAYLDDHLEMNSLVVTDNPTGVASYFHGDAPAIWDAHNRYIDLYVGNERFTAWLMFKPPGTNSQWVPTMKMDWQWGAEISRASTAVAWGNGTEHHTLKPVAVKTAISPEWTDKHYNHRGFVDDGDSVLVVTVPTSQKKTDGVVTGSVSTGAGPALDDIVVNLSSTDPNEIILPATVTIHAGDTGANFDITIRDHPEQLANVTLTVYGQAPGFSTGVSSLMTITPGP